MLVGFRREKMVAGYVSLYASAKNFKGKNMYVCMYIHLYI